MNTVRLWIAVKPRKVLAMPSLAHHFQTMAANNAWANHRLLAACARLSRQEFVAPRTSFFPSIAATLNHIVTVDWYYVDALERALDGRPANPDARRYFDPPEPFATCAEISAAQHAVDQRLLAACRRLADAQLDLPVAVVRRAGVEHESATRLLAHLFQHQIHHRGQAHAMLAGTSVAPPQLDEFFCANEAHLRADELAELGLSEAAIWK
ncbi:MAG: DinB family protein [Burkholderiales bacterium]